MLIWIIYIYKFYEKIRDIRVKNTEGRKEIKKMKKEFLEIYWKKKRGLL